MKREGNTLYLSRRNLEELLAKLDASQEDTPWSKMICNTQAGIVVAEENDKHYLERKAGHMGKLSVPPSFFQ